MPGTRGGDLDPKRAEAGGGYTPVVRSSGDRVNAVIRPEMISIRIDEPEHDGLEATIEEVSYVGPVTYFACRLAQGDPVIVARMNSEAGCDPLAPGRPCWLSWPSENLVVI